MTLLSLASALLVQLAAAGASAQTAEFLAAAHAATARYRDPRVAIADGYRAIGPDFPGMGEHWVHPGLLVGGQLDAAHPQILENPAGVFATDNWALPYERLGLRAPPSAPIAAARALSLARGGDAYLEILVRALGRPDSSGAAALRAVIIAYRHKVEGLVQQGGARPELGVREVTELARLWDGLCDALTTTAGSGGAARLGPLRGR